MRLPNGTTLMHGTTPYDPAKARAYYLRTRKLKGRNKSGVKDPNQIKYRAALDAFLKKLPMAVEGANLKDVERFVDSMRTKTDAELKNEALRIRKEKGNDDGAQVATINALLANRARVRSKKADAKKVAKRNETLKKSSGKTG